METPQSLREALEQYVSGEKETWDIDPAAYQGTDEAEAAELITKALQKASLSGEASHEVISNIAHELRSPITVLLEYADSYLNGELPDMTKTELVSLLRDELRRLNTVIDSMWNLTRMENGQLSLHKTWCTWNDVAFRAMWLYHRRLEKREITVVGLDSTPVRVYADVDLLGQVMYNLADNAAKYTDTHGTITFTFTETPQTWVMTMENTGKHMPIEKTENLFHRYARGENAGAAEGMGIGLDLVYRILQLHKGSIAVSGTETAMCWTVILPKQEAEGENQYGDTQGGGA